MAKGPKHQQLRVFYSWQSDLPAVTNLSAIRNGLDKAFKKVEPAYPELKLVRDEATRDASGSPNIAFNILEKIDAAEIFVADITTVTAAGAARPCPNPNVNFELGYAVATLGWDRIVLLFNDAVGKFPDDLPFDFMQHRVGRYTLKPNDPLEKRAELMSLLTAAIDAVLVKNPKRPSELKGLSPEKIKHDHDVENMRSLMASLHLPTLDVLIEELPHYVRQRSLWFYEDFQGVVTNSLFSLYDKQLDAEVRKLYAAWDTATSHGVEYRDTPSGQTLVFHNPGDMPLPQTRQKVWDKVDRARRQMRAALDAILARLRDAYLEVSIKDSNETAWQRYVAFQREVDRSLWSDDDTPARKRTVQKRGSKRPSKRSP